MMPRLFEDMLYAAANVTNPVTAAVVGAVIACTALWIALTKKHQKFVWILASGIVILGALPLLAEMYMNTHGVYAIRVIILGPNESPVNDAAVTCSPGGEQKRIAGGWEIDIPLRNRPSNGLFTAYATLESAFLTGHGELTLAGDYNPELTIRLTRNLSAKIRGEVQTMDLRVLSGARVSVVGYSTERVQTGPDGSFVLAAHTAEGTMIKLHVEKEGYQACEGLYQAGESSASIQLRRAKSMKPQP